MLDRAPKFKNGNLPSPCPFGRDLSQTGLDLPQ